MSEETNCDRKHRCVDCIYGDKSGCRWQIDRGVFNDYLSKRGPHKYCFRAKKIKGADHD